MSGVERGLLNTVGVVDLDGLRGHFFDAQMSLQIDVFLRLLILVPLGLFFSLLRLFLFDLFLVDLFLGFGEGFVSGLVSERGFDSAGSPGSGLLFLLHAGILLNH